MTKQFKVLKRSNTWSMEKLRKEVEETLNNASQDGWEIVDISYIENMYTVMITISK